MSEIDVQTKKNVKQTMSAAHKRLNIKRHNIRAAGKASKADTPWEDRSFHEKLSGTKRAHSLAKERRKIEKSKDFLSKQRDRLDEHGIWSKKNRKGSAMASYEKRKLKYMGVYRDKKGGEVLDAPKGYSTKTKRDKLNKWYKERQNKQGGGIALRGLGRAFLKGGKV
jgi:hypothetical protein